MFTFARFQVAQGGKFAPLAPITAINPLREREDQPTQLPLQQFSPSQEFLDWTQPATNAKSRVRSHTNAFAQSPARKRALHNFDEPPSQLEQGVNPFMSSSAASSLFQASPTEPINIPTRSMSERGWSSEVHSLSDQLERTNVSLKNSNRSSKRDPILALDSSKSILNAGALQKLQQLYLTNQTVGPSGRTTERTHFEVPFENEPVAEVGAQMSDEAAAYEVARRLVGWSQGVSLDQDSLAAPTLSSSPPPPVLSTSRILYFSDAIGTLPTTIPFTPTFTPTSTAMSSAAFDDTLQFDLDLDDDMDEFVFQ